MRRTQVLQEVRILRFEETYGGWQEGRLTRVRRLGVCERTFRRQVNRSEDGGIQGLTSALPRLPTAGDGG